MYTEIRLVISGRKFLVEKEKWGIIANGYGVSF